MALVELFLQLITLNQVLHDIIFASIDTSVVSVDVSGSVLSFWCICLI